MEVLNLNYYNRCKLDRFKLENIRAFRTLSRKDLSWNKHERRVLLYQTKDKEKIYMRYPGKESDKSFLKGAKGRRLNPYDFKPDLVLDGEHSIRPGTNYQIGLMIESFVQKNYAHKNVFVSFLLNMAYYNFHRYGNYAASTQEVYFEDGEISQVGPDKECSLKWCKQSIPQGIIDIIKDQYVKYDENDTISMEALIHYIDVLAIQEDSKYQGWCIKKYIKYDEKKEKHGYKVKKYETDSFDKSKNKYMNHIGRINFISTLANVAYYTNEEGQGRTKELKEVLRIIKGNRYVKEVPFHMYSSITGGLVQFETDELP